jgi:hypothetical protein
MIMLLHVRPQHSAAQRTEIRDPGISYWIPAYCFRTSRLSSSV